MRRAGRAGLLLAPVTLGILGTPGIQLPFLHGRLVALHPGPGLHVTPGEEQEVVRRTPSDTRQDAHHSGPPRDPLATRLDALPDALRSHCRGSRGVRGLTLPQDPASTSVRTRAATPGRRRVVAVRRIRGAIRPILGRRRARRHPLSPALPRALRGRDAGTRTRRRPGDRGRTRDHHTEGGYPGGSRRQPRLPRRFGSSRCRIRRLPRSSLRRLSAMW